MAAYQAGVVTMEAGGTKGGQLIYELNGMIATFREYGVTSYLEVGCRSGGTFHSVMSSLPAGSRGCAVDLPGSVWGGDTEASLREVCADLRAMGYQIDLLLGDSTAVGIVHKVRGIGPFDAALIDGDHRYQGVKTDFENYGPMCGLVAFHDIVGHGQRHSKGIEVEVPRFWDEIKHDRCIEIVEAGSKMGIGIWRK